MSFFLELKKYSASTPSEKEIISYIVEHPNAVVEMTMEEFAEKTYTSRSTISRFCKKHGYNGFNALKIQLAIELNTFFKDEESISGTFPFNKEDDASAISDKVQGQITLSIMETLNTNSAQKIERIAQLILSAKNLVFIGVQFSAIVATDAHFRFARIGFSTKILTTECDIMTYSFFADPNDLVFLFSYSGETDLILQAAEYIKQKGAHVVSVTKNKDNSLLKYCTNHLYINSVDDPINNLSISSNISAFALICVIYCVVINMKRDDIYNRLMKTNKIYKKSNCE